jgi:PAS domain S-box-containing protein
VQDRLSPSVLAGMLARTDRLADLLPAFHRYALHLTSGTASVLLRLNARTGHLQADSAIGVDDLPAGPWLDDEDGRSSAERAWSQRALIVVSGLADVAQRLKSRIALVAPILVGDQRLGILLVACADESPAQSARDELDGLAGLFGVALQRARLQDDAALQDDLRELAANLTTAISSSAHLGASLEVFCDRAARLFAADSASVWLHDRRARVLDLVASSDGAEMAAERRVATDDESVPVASSLRRPEPTLVPAADGGPPDLLIALRGRRRALGILEFRRVRIDPGHAVDLFDRVEEVARQVSASIENVWLLDDVLRSRRELESTFNSLTDLVIVVDTQRRVTQANRAFATRVGAPPEQLVARSVVEFFGRHVVAWLERCCGDAQTLTPGDESREITDDRLNGTFLFTASPLLGHAGDRIGTVIVARDVSAHARLETERAELRNRLTQSEKLAALGQFVAGIAHELNNPLQGVLGHLELMLHESGAASRFRRELKLVFREADRAAKIVHNLLVFAGSRRITRRRLNVNNVVEKVLTLRATACAAASITVIKDLAPRLPRVAGDALLLQQALLNIVVNAEQAMAGSSASRTLEVRTRVVRRRRIEIAITDSGPGVSPEAKSRLFEPFFTTKEVGQGTGLGLAIAYGVVQEHGGELAAENRAQGGAVFTMTLPAGSTDAVE